MSSGDRLDAASRDAPEKPARRTAARGRAKTAQRDGRTAPAGRYCVEGLERRRFLSSAIAAFAAQQTFAAGVHPYSVAQSDVNGDGRLDLIVANRGSNT